MADGADEPITQKRFRHHGAICVLGRLEAVDGQQGLLARELAALAEAVRSIEPGCTAFSVTRAAVGGPHFAVHARFADWAAFKAHGQTAHMENALARVAPVLAAPLALEIFFEI